VGTRFDPHLSDLAGNGARRDLPAVHELAAELGGPPGLAIAAARLAIDERRRALEAGAHPNGGLIRRAAELLEQLDGPSLRRVINATGVIVHTNLGRAPLAAAARDAVARAAQGYSNLELDLASGARGSRQAHVESLLCELTGAGAAHVVNNGAGALLLAACAIAGAYPTIVVSRGQAVEIGGGFRIPEVIAQSGARMLEVGTTNRIRLSDYQRALDSGSEDARAILRVHRSNFATVGFVQDVAVDELCRLGVPVIDDVGSGVIADGIGLIALGDEPSIKRSVAAGAALVVCSGDKLLGGPQAGLILGESSWVAAAAGHPLARALRIDKLSLAALEATLQLYRDPKRARREIPVLAMLDAREEALLARARRLRDGIGLGAAVVRTLGRAGGGALPLLELEGPAVALGGDLDPVSIASALRTGDPPVIARIHHGQLLLDPRTISDEEVQPAIRAARAAVAGLLR